jgi:hypothetical protein
MRELIFPDPVERPSDLFDRRRARKRVHDALRSPARRPVVILGGRLVGKTSLLNLVVQWAERRGSYLVVQLAHASSRDELAAEIVHGIHEQVDPDGADPPGLFEGDGPARLPAAGVFVRVVRDLTARAPASRFLLCVDELDSLLEGCSPDDATKILHFVLYLTEQAKLPIRFLFTMAQVPRIMRSSYASPILNQATIVELTPWSPAESAQLADCLVRGRLELDEEAQRALYAAAGGHPYFTKAVLQALLDRHPAVPQVVRPTPADLAAAAAAAARSAEVTLALSNIAEVHLAEQGVTLLDKAAASPSGLTGRDLRELPPAHDALDTLTRDGYLHHDQARDAYTLRLGLWRHWRAPRLGGRPARRAVGLMPSLQRLIHLKSVRAALLSAMAVLGLALIASLVLFQPTGRVTADGCTGDAAGVQARVSYPSHVFNGDEHRLQVRVINDTGGRRATGSAVVGFPAARSGEVNVTSNNVISFNGLGPGEQQTLSVSFTYAQLGRLLPDTGARVPVELRMSAGGEACATERWTMAVAPVPHLRELRAAAGFLLVVVVVPLLLQWLGDTLPRR